jgi:predicted RNA polymerase sigma factor
MEKRIVRAKKVLAASKKMSRWRLPTRSPHASKRSTAHSTCCLTRDTTAHAPRRRSDLRLTAALLEHPLGTTPETYALAALMCLHAARLPARVDAAGNLNTLFDQDRSQWDHDLVAEGLKFLDLSATGSQLSDYHIEAAIAAIHAGASRVEDTDWKTIVSLYNTLMAIRPSPIVALNRAIAVAQNEGLERGLDEIYATVDGDRLSTYPFCSAALGELEFRRGRRKTAREHFLAAHAVARNPMERRFLRRRVAACAGEVMQ